LYAELAIAAPATAPTPKPIAAALRPFRASLGVAAASASAPVKAAAAVYLMNLFILLSFFRVDPEISEENPGTRGLVPEALVSCSNKMSPVVHNNVEEQGKK
jgi:hypothetical protein